MRSPVVIVLAFLLLLLPACGPVGPGDTDDELAGDGDGDGTDEMPADESEGETDGGDGDGDCGGDETPDLPMADLPAGETGDGDGDGEIWCCNCDPITGVSGCDYSTVEKCESEGMVWCSPDDIPACVAQC